MGSHHEHGLAYPLYNVQGVSFALPWDDNPPLLGRPFGVLDVLNVLCIVQNDRNWQVIPLNAARIVNLRSLSEDGYYTIERFNQYYPTDDLVVSWQTQHCGEGKGLFSNIPRILEH